MLRPPPISTLFPYTTLFRSLRFAGEHADAAERPPPAKSPRFDRVRVGGAEAGQRERNRPGNSRRADGVLADRKSTRLNSSHLGISYAVFCLKKKKKILIEKL